MSIAARKDPTANLLEQTKSRLSRFCSSEPILTPILKGGSDRSFYRLESSSAGSCILIHYTTERKENAYYAEIASFLEELGVPVPKILAHDPESRLIWSEDLGAEDLHGLQGRSWKEQESAYCLTLEAAHQLHCKGYDAWKQRPIRLMNGFDEALYAWERNYFYTEFVEGVCALSLPVEAKADLEYELSGLAVRLCAESGHLVHRDFQSQNVMVREGSPYLIDFQGLRQGTFYHDLGSLLFDPYRNLNEEERTYLLEHYYKLDVRRSPKWASFRQLFHEASAQRLMQALGAYGFLGKKRGKPHFLGHIPSGLRNLRAAVEQAGSLPKLLYLVEKCMSSYLG